jgi:GWxTD domain-containing protein
MTKSIRFFITLLFAVNLSAADNHIKMNVDWAVFKYDQNQLCFELYYSFRQTDLTYQSAPNGWMALTLGNLRVFQNNALYKEFAWKNQNVLQDSSELNTTREIIDRVAYLFPAGEYQFHFKLQDLYKPGNVDSASWKLSCKPPVSGPCLSDIEIARSIRSSPEKSESPFYKNTLIVEPHPSLIFNNNTPALFFYTELYNLQSEGGYQLKYFVSDLEQNPLSALKAKVVSKNRTVNPSVEFGMLNVGLLPSGNYNFHVQILSNSGQLITENQKKFYVFQEQDMVVKQSLVQKDEFNSSPFSQMDSTDVQHEFEYIRYLIKEEIKPVYSQMKNLTQKRQFLFQFWKVYDVDPITQNQGFRQEYFNRIRYSNERFRAFKVEGWKTDRGRVYMLYGQPSDVEAHPNESDRYPYEIWYYNQIQNGVKFIFADLESHNNYRLLHSDMLGEVHDESYLDIIMKGHR